MIYLHIGLRKTGSTTIQHFAMVNTARLSKFGLIYPLAGRDDAVPPLSLHSTLARAFRPADPQEHDHSQWARVLELQARQPQAKILLSAEDFGQMTPRQVKALARLLGSAPVTVLAYVRNCADALTSEYSQQTKRGRNVEDFDQFFDGLTQAERPRVHIDPYQALKPWGERFGWRNLRVRALEPAALSGGGLLADLLEAVGLDYSITQGMPDYSLAPRNVSPGWRTVEAIRRFVADSPAPPRSAARDRLALELLERFRPVEEALEPVPKAQYLTPAQRGFLDDLYAAAITRLKAENPAFVLPAPEKTVEGRAFLPDFAALPPEVARAYLDAAA